MTVLDSVDRALADIAAGRPVVVVDDADRENEGDLIFAAQFATQSLLAFMVRHTSGYICTALNSQDADRLELPPAYASNQDPRGTAYAVSVDATSGITTGISAADRARTITLLAAPETQPGQLRRPGHMVPLRAADGGVLRRGGHTEAAVDLAHLAGMRPAGVLCELVNDDGTMKRLPELRRFADEHDLALISIADLITYRRRTEVHVTRLAAPRIRTEHGDFTVMGYGETLSDDEHLAFVHGDVSDGEEVLVRMHSECLTGDVFGSWRCDCGPQLNAAMRAVVEEGRGVVLYLRGHEGRGIGLVQKLRAYELQDAGRDTVDANLDLGLPADARDYSTGAQILADLGINSVRLLTNNPDKCASLEQHGVTVKSRIPLPPVRRDDNETYLRTKRDRMGHLIELEDG